MGLDVTVTSGTSDCRAGSSSAHNPKLMQITHCHLSCIYNHVGASALRVLKPKPQDLGATWGLTHKGAIVEKRGKTPARRLRFVQARAEMEVVVYSPLRILTRRKCSCQRDGTATLVPR